MKIKTKQNKNKEQSENQKRKTKNGKIEIEKKKVLTAGLEPGTEGLQILGVTTGLTGHLFAARILDRYLPFSHVRPVEIDRKLHSMFFMKLLLSNIFTRQCV